MKTPVNGFFPACRKWNEYLEAFLWHIATADDFSGKFGLYHPILSAFFANAEKLPGDYTQADVLAFLNSSATGNRSQSGNKPPSKGTRYNRLEALSAFYQFAEGMFITVDGTQQRLLRNPPPTTGITLSKRPRSCKSVA